MKEQLLQRLTALKSEFEAGQKMLAELESNRAELKTTLTRISGAIQVLEEELAKAAAVPSATVHFADRESNGLARPDAGGS
jgi:predicted nuclease with TOPRIM domain